MRRADLRAERRDSSRQQGTRTTQT